MPKATYKAIILNYKSPKDKLRFNQLVGAGCLVVDEIYGQIEELIKCQHPKYPQKKFPKYIKKLSDSYINNYEDRRSIGVWAYYPWNNTMVHLLEKKDFYQVKTNRNQYKITPEEQTNLSKKKIGIVGLSVGRSVAVTIAMERIAGEIRLADFDILELSNYNRIQVKLSDIGLNKTVSVAREIAELDPFLKVKIYDQGLTKNNLDDFFSKGGDLDLLIEECDGLDMKILAREKAKSLQIPVLMEASDRCMIDIERFDIEPKRPLLHGLIGDLNAEKLSKLKTNEEKLPYMLAMVGKETLSNRIKASMLEIEESITTWPQLASAVSMGGGVTADVARRILLNQLRVSGRFHVDIHEIISDRKNNVVRREKKKIKSLSKKKAKKILQSIDLPKQKLKLKKSELQTLMTAGHQAPSGGNAQPWIFGIYQGDLYLFLDRKRASSFLDYNFQASKIGLGACAQNIYLKASEMGYQAQIKYIDKKELVCSFSFTKIREGEQVRINSRLAKWIPYRASNRLNKNAGKIKLHKLRSLRLAVKNIEGAQLKIIQDTKRKTDLRDVLAAMERIRTLIPDGHKSFMDEIRWTSLEAKNTGDGIDLNTVELTASEKIGFEIAKSDEVISLVREWNKGKGFEKLMLKGIDSADVLGFIYMDEKNRESLFSGGRALQNAWIEAARLDLGFQAQSPSTFMFARMEDGDWNSFSSFEKEMLELRKKFKKLLGIKEGQEEVFIFRIFNGGKPNVFSYRRSIEKQILHLGE